MSETPKPTGGNDDLRGEMWAFGADMLFMAGLIGGFLAADHHVLGLLLCLGWPVGSALKIKSIGLKSDLTPQQKRTFRWLYAGMGAAALLLPIGFGGWMLLRR